MKTREEVLTIIVILLHEEQSYTKAYGTGKIKYNEFQRGRRDIANTIQALMWTIGAKGCFYTSWTIGETFANALALLDNANTTHSVV